MARRYASQMRRWPALVLVALVSAIITAPSVAVSGPPATQTKRQAEVNVLRVVAKNWKTWRRFGLVDPRTHLVADNTEAVCHGRGKRRGDGGYARFVCVVRPHVHHGRQGLWLSYRAFLGGRCKVRVLAYRRH